MRTGVDLVFVIAWASVGVVALAVWFVATLRLSRRHARKRSVAEAALRRSARRTDAVRSRPAASGSAPKSSSAGSVPSNAPVTATV